MAKAPWVAGAVRRWVPTAIILAAAAAFPARAQSPAPGGQPPPPGMSMAESAAMRFPQPVRAGDLIGRDVLQPVESQNVLGRVRAVVRDGGGAVTVVMDRAGLLGFGGRVVGVPLDAVVLLGADVELAALTPDQLDKLPTFSPAGTAPVPPDTVLRVGLAKPSH